MLALLLAVSTFVTVPTSPHARAPQDVPFAKAGTNRDPSQRFLDLGSKLDQKGFAVVLGTLSKAKESKREKLEDGKLGGASMVSVVSGTQWFKTQVTGTMLVRELLYGTLPQKAAIQFEQQVARLPDGKEKRQLRDDSGAELVEGTLGAFVVELGAKGMPLQLVRFVPFDSSHYASTDAEAAFAEEMADMVAVNVHVAALRQRLTMLDEARDEAAAKGAREALTDQLGKRPTMKRTEDEILLTVHAAPLEQRAQKALDAAAKSAETTGKSGSDAGKDD